MVYPTGTIKTELLSNENGVCVFHSTIYSGEGKLLASGTAYEKENSSFINKTSYVENCETSSVGRALGMAGFGIDTSVASYEEVANAVTQQDMNNETIIDKNKIQALNKSIDNAGLTDEAVALVLQQYGYDNTAEIKVKDYMTIVNDLKKAVFK